MKKERNFVVMGPSTPFFSLLTVNIPKHGKKANEFCKMMEGKLGYEVAFPDLAAMLFS